MSRDGLAELVVELAGIAAPTFAEEPRLAWLEARLRDEPGRRWRDAVGNLIWAWGDGPPRVLVLAHVDTVFPVATELQFQQRGERLVGPGIGDNASAVAVTAEVVTGLLRRIDAAPGAIAFTVGEEGLGNLRGARAACEELHPELAIAVEGQGLEHVLVDAIGSLRARVTVTGPGGHSWNDRSTPSAIHALLALGDELASRSAHETPINVGLIAGGRSINTIADHAELTIEQRSLDETDLGAFGARLDALTVEPPLGLDVEVVGRRPAGRLDRAHPLLACVRRVRAGLDLPDVLGQGSTDANAALALGIPALTLGVSRGGGMHTLEEWIEPNTLAAGAAQLDGVLEALLTPGTSPQAADCER